VTNISLPPQSLEARKNKSKNCQKNKFIPCPPSITCQKLFFKYMKLSQRACH
jgi:hypothetical protein